MIDSPVDGHIEDAATWREVLEFHAEKHPSADAVVPVWVLQRALEELKATEDELLEWNSTV